MIRNGQFLIILLGGWGRLKKLALPTFLYAATFQFIELGGRVCYRYGVQVYLVWVVPWPPSFWRTGPPRGRPALRKYLETRSTHVRETWIPLQGWKEGELMD